MKELIFFVLLAGLAASFVKKQNTLNMEQNDNEKIVVLKRLYSKFRNGQISECKLQGKQVYTATYSALDAPVLIFDTTGVQIGTCNYAWGRYDAICRELENCDVIYRIKDNIWQMPAIDKYGLARKD